MRDETTAQCLVAVAGLDNVRKRRDIPTGHWAEFAACNKHEYEYEYERNSGNFGLADVVASLRIRS